MSRTDRYDVTIKPIVCQRDVGRIVEAMRRWADPVLSHDWLEDTGELLIWGEKRLATGASWDDAHAELVSVVRRVAPRAGVASRWWDGEREPDETFDTFELPKSAPPKRRTRRAS